jgi:hypothetical protein
MRDTPHFGPGAEKDILRSCKKLEVLIVDPKTPGIANPPSPDDVRFVYINMESRQHPDDGVTGTKGETDWWTRADAFVAKKRRGEIIPSWFTPHGLGCTDM